VPAGDAHRFAVPSVQVVKQVQVAVSQARPLAHCEDVVQHVPAPAAQHTPLWHFSDALLQLPCPVPVQLSPAPANGAHAWPTQA
jgi:hypothetical protein